MGQAYQGSTAEKVFPSNTYMSDLLVMWRVGQDNLHICFAFLNFRCYLYSTSRPCQRPRELPDIWCHHLKALEKALAARLSASHINVECGDMRHGYFFLERTHFPAVLKLNQWVVNRGHHDTWWSREPRLFIWRRKNQTGDNYLDLKKLLGHKESLRWTI